VAIRIDSENSAEVVQIFPHDRHSPTPDVIGLDRPNETSYPDGAILDFHIISPRTTQGPEPTSIRMITQHPRISSGWMITQHPVDDHIASRLNNKRVLAHGTTINFTWKTTKQPC
jgi:hypothetical protein